MKRLAVLTVALGALSYGCFLHVSHYTDKDGSIVYVGDLYNDVPGPGLAGYPAVEGKFFDESGNLITVADGHICQGVNPHGLIPFKVVLPPGTRQPSRVEWSVVATPEDPYLATGLEAQIAQIVTGPRGSQWVSGELHNNSANNYGPGWICISWTDASGNVLRVGEGTAASGRLPAGGTIPFLVVEDIPAEAVAAHFYLDAGVSAPGHPLPTVGELPLSAFRHSFTSAGPAGNSYQVFGFGEIANPTGSQIYAMTEAWMHDSSGKLLAASSGISRCGVAASPGGFTYGSYQLNAPPGTTASPTVKIESWTPSNSTILSTSGVAYSPKSAGTVTVTGKVNASSSTTVKTIRVCAAVYDASGTVIGMRQAFPTVPAAGLAAAGGSLQFSVDVDDFGTPASVKAIADGY
jgi:hypothetical protein